jgi:hypothetical protein
MAGGVAGYHQGTGEGRLMGIREVPKSYVYTCDGCRKEHTQENASGHYLNSRPKYWSTLKVGRDAYDYQGCAVADGSIERLLCDSCSEKVMKAINKALEK